MKKVYTVLLSLVLCSALCVGLISVLDHDELVASGENRQIKKPEFTLASFLDGSFMTELDDYYTDTFPARQKLLKANKWLNNFYYFSGSGEENLLVIGGSTGAEMGGQSLDAVTKAAQPPEQSAPEQAAPAQEQTSETAPAENAPPETEPETADQTPQEAEEPAHVDPELPGVAEEEASYAGAVVIVGDRAMEIPTRLDDIIETYAAAVDHLNISLDGVRTISLVTPNGAAFYSPESMHTGAHDQKEMIEYCYSCMGDDIVTVDAYSAIRSHIDEYIYFRTDHHWTQLGAYYAYTAFCEAAGFDAVALEEFPSGKYRNFLGSMYTFTSGYPQSEILKENPDYLDYYLPIRQTHAKYYANGDLENGTEVSVVFTGLNDDFSNKYLCYIGGDTPVCVIETDLEDAPVCIVLKESYGNAFVPFLTSHYSKIIVIDPREFNRDGKPSLNLAEFAKDKDVDDLIVINYPYMINTKNYVSWLERLAGNG